MHRLMRLGARHAAPIRSSGLHLRCRKRAWRMHELGIKRQVHTGHVVMPPLIFTGLFVFLWCWKCAMLVIFQNTIIYNPFLPPNARTMTISEFAKQCAGVQWREERIKSNDGTEIALCVSDIQQGPVTEDQKQVYILYFQGNASSLPPRLPDISQILRRVRQADSTQSVHYTVACVSYRGFWTSHDRPSERGINMDADASLKWISTLHEQRTGSSATSQHEPLVILWGQSIGCGFATNLAANADATSTLPVGAMVLETPFTNTRAMLRALYPQKWLPYQYLWPFLRNHLDSWTNLKTISQRAQRHAPSIYIVEAANDELVPLDHGELLYKRCQEVGLPVTRYKIRAALHNDVSVRQEGKQRIAESIRSAVASVPEAKGRGVKQSRPEAKG